MLAAAIELRKRRKTSVALLLALLILGCRDSSPPGDADAALQAPVGIDADWGALELAAQAKLEATRELTARARGFDEREALAALGTNPKTGETFRLDAHLDRARASSQAPPEPAGACTGCLAFEFEGDDPVRLASAQGRSVEKDGRLEVRFHKGDYLIGGPGVELPRHAVGAIEVRLRLKRGNQFEIAWSRRRLREWPSRDHPHTRTVGRVTVDAVPGAEFHTYRIDARTALWRRLRFGDSIRTVLVRPSNRRRDRVEIDYLRFLPRGEPYADRRFGTAYETQGREMRPVLFAHPPLRLDYRVTIPERDPILSFGLGILNAGVPVDFRVSLIAAGEATEIFRRQVDAGDRWSDARVDLSQWAGQAVELRLEVEGGPGQVAFWSSPLLAGAPAEPFNIVVILEDALRAQSLSLYGHRRETSPERERFARRGVVFEYAIAQATKTRPSCPSFMTSLYPTATGVWQFTERLDDRFLTLAEILRQQGYWTGSFVQNSNAGPAAGLHQGYDQLFGRGPVAAGTALFGETTLQWIADRDGRNFFLYLHAIDPHGPYEPDPPFDHWYREGAGSGEPLAVDRRHDPEWVERPTRDGRRRRYDGEILRNDAAIGVFLDELEARGLLEHTLVVLLADHGEHLGEHGLWEHRPPGYLQVTRVPLVLIHPALPAGRRVAQVVELVDVMPTLLELAGVPTDPLLLQGESLLPLVDAGAAAGPQLALSEEAVLYRRGRNDDEVSASLFYGDLHALHSSERPALELYDIVADPGEERPAAAHAAATGRAAEVVVPFLAAMKAENMGLWRAITGGGEAVIQTDPEVREQLRALGYVE
ncbi:MAG: sulfatase [Proteobacteria bacterium]|nr:sulfatase [Pseudomonadota bacterium]